MSIADESSLTVSDTEITGNSAGSAGGGVFAGVGASLAFGGKVSSPRNSCTTRANRNYYTIESCLE